MALQGKAAIEQLRHIYRALEGFDTARGSIEFQEEPKGWRATVTIDGTEIVIVYQQDRKVEYDPDPRMFGDTEEVTRRAMQDWYPGKTTRWSEASLFTDAKGFSTSTRIYDNTPRPDPRSESDFAIAIISITHTIKALTEASQKKEREAEVVDKVKAAWSDRK